MIGTSSVFFHNLLDIEFKSTSFSRYTISDYILKDISFLVLIVEQKYGDKLKAILFIVISAKLVKRIDGAPVLGDYIHCILSDEIDQMFFFNKESLDAYQNASGGKKYLFAEPGYIKKILNIMAFITFIVNLSWNI